MEGLTIILGSAVVVETLIKYFKDAKANPTLIASMVLGIVIAFVFNLQAFAALGWAATSIYADYILTGLLISRGSNVASDIFGALRGLKTNTNTPTEIEHTVEIVE